MKGRYWLNFDADAATKPLLFHMAKACPEVAFNVRQATVNDRMGVMALELEGDRDSVQAAIKWLESEGVTVEPVEINTIEG